MLFLFPLILLWLVIPALGYILARRRGWPVAACMAVTTAIALILRAFLPAGLFGGAIAPAALQDNFADERHDYILFLFGIVITLALPLLAIERLGPVRLRKLAAPLFWMFHCGAGLVLLPSLWVGLPSTDSATDSPQNGLQLMNNIAALGSYAGALAFALTWALGLMALLWLWRRRARG